MEEEVSHSSPESDPMEVQKFHFDDIRGPIRTTQKVTILPFSTVSAHVNIGVKGHCMQVHVLMEPMPGPQLPAAVVPTATYGELHLSTCAMEIPTKAMVGQVVPTTQVPPVVQPTRTSKEMHNKSHKG